MNPFQQVSWSFGIKRTRFGPFLATPLVRPQIAETRFYDQNLLIRRRTIPGFFKTPAITLRLPAAVDFTADYDGATSLVFVFRAWIHNNGTVKQVVDCA
jgi:hypothetical protein